MVNRNCSIVAVTLLRNVTAGSCTTICARTGQTATLTSAIPTSRARLRWRCMTTASLWLPPRAERVTGSGREGGVHGLSIAPGGELHVDRGGLRVALPLVPREELLQRVRQELV